MAAIRHQRWRARLVYMQTFVSHHLWNEWRLWAPRAGACLWGVPDAWDPQASRLAVESQD